MSLIENNHSLPQSIRVFFAVFPDKTVQAQLAQEADALKTICGGRAVKPQHLHLTLLFIGDINTERIETLKQAMNNVSINRFELQLSKLRYWKHNHIVFIDAEKYPSELFLLVTALKRALMDTGFTFDRREYKPHITLIRKATHSIGPNLTQLTQSIHWHVDHWSLIQSKFIPSGVNYIPLHHWHLK